MRRRTLLKIVGAAHVIGPALVNAAPPRAIPLPAIGAPLPLLDVPLINGGTFRASEAGGHVVVVYWWASWCPFCAIQNPCMQELWDAQRPRGLKMLAISIDRRIEDPRRYMTQKGYTFPSGIMSPEIEAVLAKPGEGLPVTCVRGRDGRVLFAEMRQMFPEDVEGLARFL